MTHQVFIERCRDDKPETALLLAKSIAKRYGIAPEQILDRLQLGSFQVKANLDFASARKFMNYLEDEGALCRITDDRGETVAQSSALIATIRAKPAKGDATMQESAANALQDSDGLTVQPHKIAATLALLTPPPPDGDYDLALHTPLPPPDVDYESGLAAAYSENAGEQDLGALGGASDSSAGLRLETLDGSSDEEQAKAPNSSTADASDAAAFLPPDALEERSLELDVAPDEGPALHASASASHSVAPPPDASVSTARISAAQEAQDDTIAEDKAQGAPKMAPHKVVLSALGGSERLRFAVGILLSVLIGYGVASSVASSRENSKYEPIIAELNAKYESANTRVAWDALEDARATALESLSLRRRGIVILSLFIWLSVAGLFAFLWLRVIHWSRWEEVVDDRVPTPAPT